MVSAQEYFAPEERQQLLQLVRGLNDRLGNQLSCYDINMVHELISRALSRRDCFAVTSMG